MFTLAQIFGSAYDPKQFKPLKRPNFDKEVLKTTKVTRRY